MKKVEMVGVGIAVSYERKFPLIFFEKGVTIGARSFVDTVVRPISENIPLRYFRDRNWTFAMDNAPAHTARMTQSFCRDNHHSSPHTNGRRVLAT